MVRLVALVGLSWMTLAVVVGLFIGRAARRNTFDPRIHLSPTMPTPRTAAAPRSTEAPSRDLAPVNSPLAAEEAAATLHAMRTTASLLADTTDTLRDCWVVMTAEQRDDVLRTLATHTRFVENMADDVLQGVPVEARARLDALAEQRELRVQQTALAAIGRTIAAPSPLEDLSSAGDRASAAAHTDTATTGGIREAVFEPVRPHRRWKAPATVAAVGATLALLPAAGAAAATGSLPQPAQRAVAATVGVLGIDLPRTHSLVVPVDHTAAPPAPAPAAPHEQTTAGTTSAATSLPDRVAPSTGPAPSTDEHEPTPSVGTTDATGKADDKSHGAPHAPSSDPTRPSSGPAAARDGDHHGTSADQPSEHDTSPTSSTSSTTPSHGNERSTVRDGNEKPSPKADEKPRPHTS